MNPSAILRRAPGAPVPFVRLDAAEPQLKQEILAAVERVGDSAGFTLGDEVENFEQAFAAWCGAAHAVGVSSGTSALELVLRAFGIGPGDEVIVPTNSFIATAEAVTAIGATPILVDVDPETALITAEIVAVATTERTRCVLPVHLYGRSVDIDPLLDFCRPRGIRVVEDACQAHGAVYRDRRAGTHADAGCFSFYPTKNLGAWGDGGAVITSDDELAAKLRLLRSHGEGTRHHHEVASGTHRLHAIQAAILDVKLPHLDRWTDQRRAAGAALTDALAGTAVTPPAPVAADGDHVFHLFVVRTPDRDGLREHLASLEVASAVHYPTPIHLQPCYADLDQGPLPVAERLAAESCTLPIFPSITEAELASIVNAVSSFVPRP